MTYQIVEKAIQAENWVERSQLTVQDAKNLYLGEKLGFGRAKRKYFPSFKAYEQWAEQEEARAIGN